MTSGDKRRILFVNQGVIGGGAMMGHVAADESLRRGADRRPDVEARFVRLPPWSPASRLLATSLPLLSRTNLDLHVNRWHLAEAIRARKVTSEQVRTWSPLLLHVDSQVAAFGLTRLMLGIPTFLAVDVPVREHETAIVASQRGLRSSIAVERRVYQRAEQIFAYHRWSARAVIRCCPDAKVTVLHPGIDVEKFRPVRRDRNPELRILFVGGDFEAKGGRDLLVAVRHLLGRGVRLDVVTSTPVDPVEGLVVHRLGVGDPRLVELYQGADVMCLPTHRDVGPWAILEAFGCGKPVVGSAVGAIPELIADSGAGICVEPHQPGRLRAALETLLFDEPKREALGQRARAFVEENFDTRRQVEKLFDVMLASTPATGRGRAVDHASVVTPS